MVAVGDPLKNEIDHGSKRHAIAAPTSYCSSACARTEVRLTPGPTGPLRIASPLSVGRPFSEGMLTGTVRTSAFFLGQPEQTRRRVQSTFDRLGLDYRRGEASP